MESSNDIRICRVHPDELEPLNILYSSAFPEEDLLPLIQDLHNDTQNMFSFVFEEEGDIIGHICFTVCHINADEHTLALLGPMAVAPNKQKQGIGSLLIQHGLQFLSERKFNKVMVLGDPNYYGRFGFSQEHAISPPYPLPKEWQNAWQSIALPKAVEKNISGHLMVPPPWQKPELWSN